jgi:xanthine dehydrogenase YagS FAD-binding subunit
MTEYLAGGTDVLSRRPIGRSTGPYTAVRPDLRGVSALPGGGVRIGAMTTVAELAADPLLRPYPALTATAGALATPQIRTVATLGGNLLQRNRCWYYRNPHFSCLQTGGSGCPARAGAHLYSSVVDLSPCVAPHPSTVAVALLVQDAVVEVAGRGRMPVADLYDADPTRDHVLAPSDLLLAVELPAGTHGERAAYHRATARSRAEWPLVEAVARLVPTPADPATAPAGVGRVAVAVGGVARTPLRLTEVERAIADGASPADAAATVTRRCAPLAQTGYKVGLLRDTVRHVLETVLG